tara:strand:+ start:11647 stop:14796 length:3150 start_codon:yes stop_codon:yes gene_type:complete
MAKTTASLAFNLYEGFVEDIKDPKKSGRVRVRVKTIHSYEGEGKDRVGIPPTEELPWATVMMPTTHATSTHQISNHNLKVGDAVVVKFSDGSLDKVMVVGVVPPHIDGVLDDTEKLDSSTKAIPLEETTVVNPEQGSDSKPQNVSNTNNDGGNATAQRSGTEGQSDAVSGIRANASEANQSGTFEVSVASADCPESPPTAIQNILTEFFATLQHTNGNVGSYYISKYTRGLFELKSIANGYISRVRQIIQAAMSRAAGEMMNMLRKAVKALMKAILAPLPGILQPVTEWFEQMLEKIGCSMMDITSRIENFATNILMGYVGNIVNWSMCQVKRFTDGILGRMLGEISGLINGLFGGISKVLGAIGGAIDVIGGGLSSIMKLLGISCMGKKKCPKAKKKSTKKGSYSGLKGGFNELDQLLADLETGNHLPVNSYCGDATTDPEPVTEVNVWGPTVPNSGSDGGTRDPGTGGTTGDTNGDGTGIDYDDIANAICNDRYMKVLDIVEIDAVKEGDYADVKITRTGNTDTTSSVTYQTQDGTAKATEDYCPANGYIGFGIGETEKTIQIKTLNNGVKDGKKYFFVKIQHDGCGKVLKDVARIWITDPSAWTDIPTISVPDVGVVSSAPNLNLTNPVYHLNADKEVVYEGEEVTFTLNTQNVDDGTVVNYTIGREDTGITYDDLEYVIEDGVKSWITGVTNMQRSFTVSGSKAEVTIKLLDDGIVEDTNQVAEQLYIELNNLSTSTGVAVLDAIQAVADPSKRTVKITPSTVVVEEGESVTYKVTTTNFDNGELLAYTIFGTNITQSDIKQPLTGNLYIENNEAEIVINVLEDNTIEQQENMIFSIDAYGASATVVIVIPTETPAEGETDEPIYDDAPQFDYPIIDPNTGGIIDIEVKRSGRRYVEKPFITLDSNNGYGAYVEPIINSEGYLTRVRVVHQGVGYTGQYRPDTTVCQLVNIWLTNVGGFYKSEPSVLVDDVSGIARARISDQGYVTGIELLRKDLTYPYVPKITIVGGNGFGAKAIADLQCVPAEDSNLIIQGLAKDPANYVDCP